ncbi:MAG TPA: glycoside hydrolase [Tepidisphaeraceae bacterium]|jgi:O-glycosyl hydrolase
MKVIPLACAAMLFCFGSFADAQTLPATGPASRPTSRPVPILHTTPVNLSINLQDQQEPFRGWGTSLCWWAHGIGLWDEAKVDETVKFITDPDVGMGMNLFRYNIGGGDDPSHKHLRRWGDVPGFKASADAPYDWNADAGQRNVLLKLIKASKDKPILEAFSNSPPYWMTISGCASGAIDGGPNLKPGFEKTFADYLAEVVKFYHDKHNVTFDTLNPFNEPDGGWWKAMGRQEGMGYPDALQPAVILATRAALDERGLKQVLISAPDGNNLNNTLRTLKSYDAQTLGAIGQINTHTYGGNRRVELREAIKASGKLFSQSETGPIEIRGSQNYQVLKMAERVILDMNHMRPQSWCTWQMIDTGAWGAFHEVRGQPQTLVKAKLFHMLSTFGRRIRPGDRFVNLDSNHVSAVVSQKRNEVVLMLVNVAQVPQDFKLTLQNGGKLSATAEAIITDNTRDLAPLDPVAVQAGVVTTSIPAESLVRLVLTTTP